MIEIRPATQEEMGQIGLMTSYVYGGAFGDGEDNFTTQNNRPEWTLCAFDGPTLVASYAAKREGPTLDELGFVQQAERL